MFYWSILIPLFSKTTARFLSGSYDFKNLGKGLNYYLGKFDDLTFWIFFCKYCYTIFLKIVVRIKKEKNTLF